jgi:peptidoglycan/LPS O-acetylase OafA/YrhL
LASSSPAPDNANSANGTGDALERAAPVAPLDPARPAVAVASEGKPGSRMVILDGIRGMAVTLVFIYHCTVLDKVTNARRVATEDGFPEAIRAIGGVDRVWEHLTFLNGLAPLLFFVLSGFLITNILSGTKHEKGYFKNFYARRALRIVPLYYLMVFLSLVVLPVLFALPQLESFAQKAQDLGRIEGRGWMYWAFLANISIAQANGFQHGILDITWSLSIEEQFYLVWPLVVLVLSRKALIAACLGMFVFGLAFRCFMVFGMDGQMELHGGGPTFRMNVTHVLGQPVSAGVGNAFEAVGVVPHPIAVYVHTLGRLGSLGLGSLLALVWKEPGLLARIRPTCIVLATLLVPFVWITLAVEAWSGNDYSEFGVHGGPFSRTFGDSVVVLGLAAFLVCCITAKPTDRLSRILTSGPMLALAKYSYGIFLFHMPIRGAVRDIFFGPAKWNASADAVADFPLVKFPVIAGSYMPAQVAFYVISFVLTFAAAFLSWHLFEKHFLKFKKYFRYERSRAEG